MLKRYAIVMALSCAPTIAAAQQGGARWTFHDAAFRFFDQRDGVTSQSIYAFAEANRHTLWAASDDGAMYYTGRSWRLLRLPAPFEGQVANAFYTDPDDRLWVGTTVGVLRVDDEGHHATWDAHTGGLPDPDVLSITRTDAFDAQPSIVVGTRSGLARLRGERFVAESLPPGFPGYGIIAADAPLDDGTPALWVGSQSGGLLRYARGTWRRFGAVDGFAATSVEQIVHAPPGFDTELFIATEEGLFARVRGQDRFRRIAAAGTSIYRVLPVVRENGARELWVGLRSGLLLRNREERWDTIAPTPQGAPAPVIALRAQLSPGGGTDIYVGLRGSRMTRISLGPAGALELPGYAGRWVRDLEEIRFGDAPAELWIGTVGDGVLRYDGRRVRQYTHADGLPSDRIIDVEHWVEQGHREVWIGTALGPARWNGDRFTPMMAGLQPEAANDLDVGPGPDGRRTVLLGMRSGLWWFDHDRWRRWPGFPNEPVVAIEPGDWGGGEQWMVATDSSVYVQRGRAWVREQAFPSAQQPRQLGLKFLRLRGIGPSLWVFGEGTTTAWRSKDGRWRLLDPATHPGFEDEIVRHVEGSQGGDVVVSGTGGVRVLRHVAGDSMRVVAVFGEGDGLPSDDAWESFAAESGAFMWVATARGVGRIPAVPADDAPPDAALPALMLVVRPQGQPPLGGARAEVPFDHAPLTVTLALREYHRELDTRYSLDIERDGRLIQQGTWTSDPQFLLSSLAPGRYRVVGRARDWRGHEGAATAFAFNVAPPFFRSIPGLLLLAMSGLSLALSGHLWRTRALEESKQRHEENERRFRALFERSPDAHLLFEGAALVGANEAARHLFGAADREALARLVAAGWAEDETTGEFDAEGAGVPPRERTVQRADGTTIPVSIARTRIELESRPLVHVVLRDLSDQRREERERRELERQLVEAQRLDSLGTLAGGVAHDFNNLLTVIRVNTELAREMNAAGHPALEELAAAAAAGERATALVRQILTFSRRTAAERDAVSVATLVREIEPMLRALIPRSVTVSLHIADEAPLTVQGDATQLQQALLNLCTNAEYALRGRTAARLEIGAALAEPPAPLNGGRWVRLWVADNGAGMPAEVRERIFEPFFTTKPVGEGTGLGLSVLHGIVTAHGGTIQVESAPGNGTRFDVWLPLAAEAASAPRVPRPEGELQPGLGQRVVIVDDDPPVLRAMSRIVERLGYRTMPFERSLDALAYFERGENADLLLTDQTMPQLAGDALVEAVRRRRPHLPTVLISGYALALSPQRLRALGIAQVLTKPTDAATLATALAAALQRGNGVAAGR